MIQGIPKISVTVITYNQEDVICRAIDSLIVQRDYIYEICVSDDCSTDGTWDILQRYSKEYPGLFNLNRNDPNICIFENIEKTWSMPSGDLVCSLAGDDAYENGWFKGLIDFICNNNIDYKNEALCIYGDYRAVYPNGDSFIFRNRMIQSRHPALKLAIRGFIGNRSTCISMKVLKKFVKVSNGRSYIAEQAQDRQKQMFSQHNYYIPIVGNVYYARIGVSMHMDKKIRSERSERWTYFEKVAEKQGAFLDTKDKSYLRAQVAKENGEVLSKWKNWLMSIEPSLLFTSLKIRRCLFALMRRMPHNNPIVDYKL